MLNNKVVVVTGGAGLLGKVFIEGIIQNGGIGVIGDIDERTGNSLQKELREKYGENKVFFQRVDITSEESIQNLIIIVANKFKRLDALVNNAYPRNKNYGRHFFDVKYQDFCENINIHLGGYFLISQKFAEYFRNQQLGNIINIASIYGVIAPRFEIYEGTTMTMPIEYAVIKSGIIQLTKYMAKYLKASNVRVNSISPGGIVDNQPDIFRKNYRKFCNSKGMLDKSDVLGTLLFLISDLSATITGQNIINDDGFSL